MEHWTKSSEEEDSMFLLDLMLIWNGTKTNAIYSSENELHSKMWFFEMKLRQTILY